MKVLHVALTDHTYAKFHHRWVDGLVRAGHEVVWVSEDWGDSDRLRAAGVKVRTVPMARGLSPLKVLRCRRALRAVYRDEVPDVVVSEQTVPGFLARMAQGRGRRTPHVHIVHSWPWHDLTRPAVRAVSAALERWAARRTTHHVVISAEDHADGLRRRIVRVGGSTQMAVGIDPVQYGKEPSSASVAAARRELGFTGPGPGFLFVGRIVAYKGVFDVVEAFRRLQSRLPTARLAIVGRPDQRPASLADDRRLRRILAGPGHDAVTLVGRVEDLAAAYAACDVFVMPSKYEGLGLVYLEAGALGRPSVGYDVRGVREAVLDGKTGLLVPPGDLQRLADAMVRLGTDGRLRARFGDAARDRWRGRYDNESFAKAMQQLIVTAGQRPRATAAG